jgi:hypothetical protein
MSDSVHPASIVAFTDLEEAFFREGDAMSEEAAADPLGEVHWQPPRWRRLLDSVLALFPRRSQPVFYVEAAFGCVAPVNADGYHAFE